MNTSPVEAGSKGHGDREWIFFFVYIYILEFDLPTYSITLSAHPVNCPPSVPITQSPHPSAPLPFHCYFRY